MAEPIQIEADGGSVIQGEAGAIPVPSGQEVTLQEVIWNVPGPEGLTSRFRFIAPAINREAGSVDFETASTDMQHLCETYALDRLSSLGPMPRQVIISLADRALPFGEPAPEATQFFEAYRIEGKTCIWEAF